MSGKPILCVDFDGVLHAYTSPWQGADVVADGPVPGAIAWLREALEAFDVHVYSSRSREPGGIEAMRSALQRWEDAYDARAREAGGARPDVAAWARVKFPAFKPPAFLTIDDRAVTFVGSFGDLESARLLAFRPWNRP